MLLCAVLLNIITEYLMLSCHLKSLVVAHLVAWHKQTRSGIFSHSLFVLFCLIAVDHVPFSGDLLAEDILLSSALSQL